LGLIILLLLVVALVMVENLAFVLRHRWQWSDETSPGAVGYWWFFAMILVTMHATGIRPQKESSQGTNSQALSPAASGSTRWRSV